MRALALILSGLVLPPAVAGAVPVWEEAAAKARNATVTCAAGSECSPSVGLLSFTTPSEPNQCTASLVAPDIIVTNGHCVPDDLRKAGASCAGRMWMNFLPADGLETQLECSEVIAVQKEPHGRPEVAADYAFLRLKTASVRPVLSLSRQGFADEELVSFERVSPVKIDGGIAGVQSVVPCRTVQHSLLAPFTVSSGSTIALLTECQSVPGNSGSPLRGADGSVRGVIQAKAGLTASYLARKGITLEQGLVSHGFGTNFACQALPAELGIAAPSEECAASSTKNRSFAAYERATAAFLAALSPELRALEWRVPDFQRDLIKYEPFMLRAPGPQLNYRVKASADFYGRVERVELQASP